MSRPNLIHLSWHDVGRFLNCYGRPEIESPNVDRVAAEGLRFTNYWATSSICSPSRACALTGRYSQTIGVAGLCHAPENYNLEEGVPHLSHIMRDNGYRTALIGWQHETTHDKVHSVLGFDEIHHNDPCPECETVSREAVQWLEARAGEQASGEEKPFYLQLGFIEIHRSRGNYGQEPMDNIHIPDWIVDCPDLRAEMALQQANIRKADRGVGVVLEALDRLGLTENTILIFTSDHGMGVIPHAKTTLYDGGIEIPLIVRWPAGGISGGRRCDWYLSNVDFLPTLLDVMELPKPGTLHGRSFAAAFDENQNSETEKRSEIFAHFVNAMRMIRTPSHKLIWNAEPRRVPVAPVNMDARASQPGWPVWEFYDLEKDPLETRNLSTHVPIDHGGDGQQRLNRLWEKVPHQPEIEEDLRKRLFAKLKEIGDPIIDMIPPSAYDLRARAELRGE